MELKFYDANLSYGYEMDVRRMPAKPCHTFGELREAMDRCGVLGGLVRTVAADVGGVKVGNEFLARDLSGAGDYWGMYTIVPSCTHEIPAPKELPAALRKARMPVIRLNPPEHRYLAKPAVLGDYLAVAEEEKIPVMFDTSCGPTLEQIWDYLEAFPKLTAILAYASVWPTDRYYRPLLEAFPNLRMELSFMLTDQGLEELVRLYGAERFLYGSRFPFMSPGGGMLQLRCAEISDGDKAKIAGENLCAMIREVLK